MKNLPLMIGITLRIGVLIAFCIVFMGGIIYLYQHGTDVVVLHTFQNNNQYNTIPAILTAFLQYSPMGWIQCGTLILVLTQWVRVILTAWLFYQNKETILFILSLFIGIALIYSLLYIPL